MHLFQYFKLSLFIFSVVSLLFAVNYDPYVLNDIEEEVKESLREGMNPVLLFDIDDTLTRTQGRNLKILREAAQDKTFNIVFPREMEVLKTVKPIHIKYDFVDTLLGLGISNTKLNKDFGVFWEERFFSNPYVARDKQVAGSAVYVSRLHRLGAHIIYLTGRDAPRMRQGTVENLRKNGFPLGPNADLWMKPNADLKDLDFKKNAFGSVSNMGEVIAAFENEPVNLNVMGEAFPNSTLVFVDTIHSKRPEAPVARAKWIANYE